MGPRTVPCGTPLTIRARKELSGDNEQEMIQSTILACKKSYQF